MHLKASLILLLLIFANLTLSKRSRGRSRGSSGSSTTFWTRKSKSSSESKPVVTQPKPSAPKEPEVKKQTANVQQSAPNSRPIGWDVDKTNIQKQNVNPSYAVPKPQQAGAAYPNSMLYPQNSGHAGYGNAQPAGGYPNHGTYQGQNPQPYPMQSPGSYQNNMGGYGNNPNVPHSNMGYGNMPQSNMGYGNVPHSNMGYGNQQTGMMGFGGQNHGYGGSGGYGGFGGGYGGYGGYGMKKSGGFLGKHAFRNILGGLFVGYLVSGLVSRPYKVYNFYNQPQEREEITLPANVLTLCNENATNICVPGTTAICTQDNKILCVSTLATASPCPNNNGELCVNSTIPCMDANDPLCQNKTSSDNTTTLNLPCLTNMTLQDGSTGLPPNVSLPTSENNKFCVTMMAVPDLSVPVDDGKTEMQTNQGGLPPANMTTEGFNATLPVNL